LENKFLKYFNEDKNIEGFYNLIKSTSSDNTLETYIYALVELFRYCKDNNIDFYKSSEISLDKFVSRLSANNKSSSTINVYCSAIQNM